MRKMFGCGLLILMVVGAYFFIKSWRGVTPWAFGTGRIGGDSRDMPARDNRSVSQKTKSMLGQIADNPTRFEGKRATVRGRVRGAGKYASNRNIYTLVDGDDRLLVIDDKAPPKEYWPRTVTGTVKTIGPKIGGLNYAYIVDVKQGVKINPPRWQDISHFFTDKYDEVRKGL